MLKLEDREWKEFKIGELFTPERGNAKDISNKKDGEKVALISAMDNNNGFNKIVNPERKEKVFKNTYAINNNGNGLCLTYYHKYSFIATTDVTILHCKNKQLENEYIAQFIITSIKLQK